MFFRLACLVTTFMTPSGLDRETKQQETAEHRFEQALTGVEIFSTPPPPKKNQATSHLARRCRGRSELEFC